MVDIALDQFGLKSWSKSTGARESGSGRGLEVALSGPPFSDGECRLKFAGSIARPSRRAVLPLPRWCPPSPLLGLTDTQRHVIVRTDAARIHS